MSRSTTLNTLVVKCPCGREGEPTYLLAADLWMCEQCAVQLGYLVPCTGEAHDSPTPHLCFDCVQRTGLVESPVAFTHDYRRGGSQTFYEVSERPYTRFVLDQFHPNYSFTKGLIYARPRTMFSPAELECGIHRCTAVLCLCPDLACFAWGQDRMFLYEDGTYHIETGTASSVLSISSCADPSLNWKWTEGDSVVTSLDRISLNFVAALRANRAAGIPMPTIYDVTSAPKGFRYLKDGLEVHFA